MCQICGPNPDKSTPGIPWYVSVYKHKIVRKGFRTIKELVYVRQDQLVLCEKHRQSLQYLLMEDKKTTPVIR